MTDPRRAACFGVGRGSGIVLRRPARPESGLRFSQTRQNLASELTEVFGAEVAASFANAFVGAVAGHRQELDAICAMRRALN
jgi:hypothetical protein